MQIKQKNFEFFSFAFLLGVVPAKYFLSYQRLRNQGHLMGGRGVESLTQFSVFVLKRNFLKIFLWRFILGGVGQRDPSAHKYTKILYFKDLPNNSYQNIEYFQAILLRELTYPHQNSLKPIGPPVYEILLHTQSIFQ